MLSIEQLEQELKKTDDELKRLAQADKPLTKEERSWRGKLQVRKSLLAEIKRSKEGDNKSSELYHTTLYEMLIDWGERRPLLMFLISNILRARFGMGGFRM
ncbi:MAG: hypothetical protein V1771_03460 [Chloroflexota bacterium]